MGWKLTPGWIFRNAAGPSLISDIVSLMPKPRPALFRGRHFEDEITVLCVRWYLRYCLTYRDLEELMAERGLNVDHSTSAR
jgi:hypothetical protein